VGAWARFESEHKSERIKRARQQQAVAGEFHGGPRPFGYEKDGITVKVDEAAEIVTAINAVITGVSLRSLVRDLNQRGVPTATGQAKWSSATLRGILTGPRIAGFSSLHGEVVGKARWHAIVPEDAWRAASAILEDPTRVTAPRGGTIRWLGSGIYVCGVCERRDLRVSTAGKKRRPVYRCRAREFVPGASGHVVRTAETLDEYVETVIVERLKQADLDSYLVDASQQAEVADLRRKHLEVTEQQTQLGVLWAAGTFNQAQFEAANSRLSARLDSISQKLELLGRRSPLFLVAGASDMETRWFGTEPNCSDGLSFGARRTILDALATVTVLRSPTGRARDGVYFDPSYVKIEWKSSARRKEDIEGEGPACVTRRTVGSAAGRVQKSHQRYRSDAPVGLRGIDRHASAGDQ